MLQLVDYELMEAVERIDVRVCDCAVGAEIKIGQLAHEARFGDGLVPNPLRA